MFQIEVKCTFDAEETKVIKKCVLLKRVKWMSDLSQRSRTVFLLTFFPCPCYLFEKEYLDRYCLSQ